MQSSGVDIASAFASLVREQRQIKGWTQQQLADHLNNAGIRIDSTAITRLEGGQRSARIDEAVALASALRIDLNALVPSNARPIRQLELDATHEIKVRQRGLTEAELLVERKRLHLAAAEEAREGARNLADFKRKREPATLYRGVVAVFDATDRNELRSILEELEIDEDLVAQALDLATLVRDTPDAADLPLLPEGLRENLEAMVYTRPEDQRYARAFAAVLAHLTSGRAEQGHV